MHKFKFILFIFLVPILVVAYGAVVMFLWNWLVPDLFGGPLITFWQSIGVIILSKLLFGGFSGGKKCKDRSSRNSRSRWAQKWESKMASMSPEEKEKWKAKMKNCGPSWWKGNEEESNIHDQGSAQPPAADEFEQ